jgi:hypothetical protein
MTAKDTPPMTQPPGDPMADWDLIDGYTRADALADGTLIAVPTDVAANAGFRCHVALTRAAWEDCVAWEAADNARKGTVQDEAGRLWDVAWMASREISRVRPGGHGPIPVPFAVFRVPRGGPATYPLPVGLVAWLGPGDDGEPVITITRPEED